MSADVLLCALVSDHPRPSAEHRAKPCESCGGFVWVPPEALTEVRARTVLAVCVDCAELAVDDAY